MRRRPAHIGVQQDDLLTAPGDGESQIGGDNTLPIGHVRTGYHQGCNGPTGIRESEICPQRAKGLSHGRLRPVGDIGANTFNALHLADMADHWKRHQAGNFVRRLEGAVDEFQQVGGASRQDEPAGNGQDKYQRFVGPDGLGRCGGSGE